MKQKRKPNKLSDQDATVLEYTIGGVVGVLLLIAVIAIPLYLNEKYGDAIAVASLVGILVVSMILLDLSDGDDSVLKSLFGSYARIAKRGVWLVKKSYNSREYFDDTQQTPDEEPQAPPEHSINPEIAAYNKRRADAARATANALRDGTLSPMDVKAFEASHLRESEKEARRS